MRTDSSLFEQFTLGIEEEFQIVDPNTRELRSHVSEILEEGRMLLGEQVKPEMIQSMIEVGTGICSNIQEARSDVIKLRRAISALAESKGLDQPPHREPIRVVFGFAIDRELHARLRIDQPNWRRKPRAG